MLKIMPRIAAKSELDIVYIGFLLGHGGDAMLMLDLATGMAARGHPIKLVVPQLETSVSLAELCQERGLPIDRTPWIRSDAWQAKQNPLDLVRLFRTYRAPILHRSTPKPARKSPTQISLMVTKAIQELMFR